MMHPDTELRFVSDQIGMGVFATKFIPKGTIVWALDDLDMILNEAYVESLEETRQEIIYKYSYQNGKGDYILCWDIGRYMNHSFHPTCIGTAYEFELAARDIYPGEELTCDYGILCLDEPFECLPEEGCTRTKVMPDDILHFYKEWDQIALDAILNLHKVKQPLQHLMKKEYINKVTAVASGHKSLDSILTTYQNGASKL